MQEKKVVFSETTGNYLMCFNNECAMHNECLRYVVGQQIAQKRKWGLSVFPTALHDGQCEFFQKNEQVKLAYGFHQLYTNIPRHLRSSLRNDITRYLGSVGSYYRYDKGERKLSPAQQQDIKGFIAEYGTAEEYPFDHYEIGFNLQE